MANLEKKGANPMVVGLLNLFLFGCVGYFQLGQKDKGIKVLIGSVVLSVVGLGWILMILAFIDGKAVAEAVEAGEEVDENEYKNEILYKIISLIDKTAIYKAA